MKCTFLLIRLEHLTKLAETSSSKPLLRGENNGLDSQWSKIKKEPKKPTNTEVRDFLSHLDWLKSLVNRLPAVDHIPVGKWRQTEKTVRKMLSEGELKGKKLGRKWYATGAAIKSHFDERTQKSSSK
jgi:hypothetical protein